MTQTTLTSSKAIFLDRDGTLILDKHYQYKTADLEYFPSTREALQVMQSKGYQLFLITNQSGIGRNLFTIQDLEIFHQRIQLDMENWNLKPFQAIKFCPHSPEENCSCRKPHPKMILDLIEEYSLDAASSYMIGDKLIDAQCGQNAKAQGILIGTESKGFPTYPDILSFAEDL